MFRALQTRPRQDARRAKAYCGNLRFFEGDVSSLATSLRVLIPRDIGMLYSPLYRAFVAKRHD